MSVIWVSFLFISFSFFVFLVISAIGWMLIKKDKLRDDGPEEYHAIPIEEIGAVEEMDDNGMDERVVDPYVYRVSGSSGVQVVGTLDGLWYITNPYGDFTGHDDMISGDTIDLDGTAYKVLAFEAIRGSNNGWKATCQRVDAPMVEVSWQKPKGLK